MNFRGALALATIIVCGAPWAEARMLACSMQSSRDELCLCEVASLRPTQMSVGFIEVARKEKKIKQMSADDLDAYQHVNPEPVVIGPEGALFIIDHHHLARALSNQHVKTTYCTVRLNVNNLSLSSFWAFMQKREWVYPYDNKGQLHPVGDLPHSVAGLEDDIYRSLAGRVRDEGGYEKSSKPFAEFAWADFFRKHIPTIGAGDEEFQKAVERGLELARSDKAKDLPGFRG